MYIDANKEVFELAEIDGVPVLFTHARIDRETVPMGFSCYDVRESEGFSGVAVTLENRVIVNHWGTILSREIFPLKNGFYQIKDEMNYLGETMTAAEYLETEQRQTQEQKQAQSGMELK